MVRPRGSQESREVGLLFANLVTVEDSDPDARVLRTGTRSIFAVLSCICPWTVREGDTGSRDGLSLAEFNKVLESNGFLKSRQRLSRSSSAYGLEDAGSYCFAKRRWRDPSDDNDRSALIDGFRTLQKSCIRDRELLDEDSFLEYMLSVRKEQDLFAGSRSASKKRRAEQENMRAAKRVCSEQGSSPVSYTHLRAHETEADL
eukprot:2278913-Rhodomonas_salina.1